MTYDEATAKCAEMNAAFLRNDEDGEYEVYLAAQAMRKQITNAGWKLQNHRGGIFSVIPQDEEVSQ